MSLEVPNSDPPPSGYDESAARLCRSMVAAGILATLLLPVGLFHGFGPTYDLLSCLHLAAFSFVLFESLRTLTRLFTRENWLLVVSAAICAGVGLAISLLPPTATDALVHHLAVPKWWIERGSIVPIEWHDWSYYPMLLNLPFVTFLRWGVPELCAIYHALHLLVLAALTAHLGKQLSVPVGRWSAFLTLTLPIFVRLAGAPLVDLGLALYATLAVVILVTSDNSRVNLVLAGAAFGLAMGTKYNGLLFVLFAVPFFAFYVGNTPRRRIAAALILATVAGVILAPWLLRNYWWTGNPVYPLAQNLFGSLQPSLPFAPRQIRPLNHRLWVYEESILDLLLLPLRVLVTGRDGDPRQFDGVLTPLLGLAALSLARLRSTRWIAPVVLVCISYSIVAGTNSALRVRYFAPVLPLFCVLSAVGLQVLSEFHYRWKTVVALLVALHAGGSILYAIRLAERSGIPQFLEMGFVRRSFLQSRLGDYPLIEWVNGNLPPESRVALLGTSNNFYYFDRQVMSRGFFSFRELVSWLRQGFDEHELAKRWKALGVTHLFVHTERLQATMRESLNSAELVQWNAFSGKRLNLLHASGAYSVWELVDPEIPILAAPAAK